MATGIAQLLNSSGGDADKLHDLLLEYVHDNDSDDLDESILDVDKRDCPSDSDLDDDFDMTKGDFDSAKDVAMALPKVVMGMEEECKKVAAHRYVLLYSCCCLYMTNKYSYINCSIISL